MEMDSAVHCEEQRLGWNSGCIWFFKRKKWVSTTYIWQMIAEADGMRVDTSKRGQWPSSSEVWRAGGIGEDFLRAWCPTTRRAARSTIPFDNLAHVLRLGTDDLQRRVRVVQVIPSWRLCSNCVGFKNDWSVPFDFQLAFFFFLNRDERWRTSCGGSPICDHLYQYKTKSSAN